MCNAKDFELAHEILVLFPSSRSLYICEAAKAFASPIAKV